MSFKMAFWNAFIENGYKKLVFVKKLKILYILDDTVWLEFRQHVVQVRIRQIMYGET